MCNCGKKRQSIKQAPVSNTINTAPQTVRQQQAIRPLSMPPVKTVNFQYLGNTALSITGSITRKNYRFGFPGDIQAIDFNDASAMLGVPVLKRI